MVSSNDGILTFATNRGRVGVSHDLSRGTTVGICYNRSCVQRTALATCFVSQLAKSDIQETFERTMRRVRVDVQQRNNAVTGERDDNRGGRGQGIAVEVVCKMQSAGSEV